MKRDKILRPWDPAGDHPTKGWAIEEKLFISLVKQAVVLGLIADECVNNASGYNNGCIAGVNVKIGDYTISAEHNVGDGIAYSMDYVVISVIKEGKLPISMSIANNISYIENSDGRTNVYQTPNYPALYEYILGVC